MGIKKYCILILLVFMTLNANAQTIKLSVKTLPKNIIESFRQDYPDARFISAIKQTAKGNTHYEIDCMDGDSKRIIHYDPEGKIVRTEEIITAERLPEPVASSIAKKYPKSRISKIKLLTKDSQSEYAVMISEKKKKSEVIFSPNGSILRRK